MLESRIGFNVEICGPIENTKVVRSYTSVRLRVELRRMSTMCLTTRFMTDFLFIYFYFYLLLNRTQYKIKRDKYMQQRQIEEDNIVTQY